MGILHEIFVNCFVVFFVHFTCREFQTTHWIEPNTKTEDSIVEVRHRNARENRHDKFSFPMCAKMDDYYVGNLIDGDRMKFTFHDDNTRISCMERCNLTHFKYAGVKNDSCLCAEKFRNNISPGICDLKCPGDRHEVCGGEKGISLLKTRSQTVKSTGKGVNIATTEETAVEITTAETVTRALLSEELSYAKPEITTESQIYRTSEGTINDRNFAKKGNGDNTSTATVILIAVASVVMAAVAIAILVHFILRRRQKKRNCNMNYHRNGPQHNCHPGSACKGNLDERNLLEDQQKSKGNSPHNVKAVPLAVANEAKYSEVTYSAENTQAAHYGHFKSNMDDAASSKYSHMTINKTTPIPTIITDNTYAQIGDDMLRERSSENQSDTENTYNTLQTSHQVPTTGSKSKNESNQDDVYDHAKAGGRIQDVHEIHVDEYEHINSVNPKNAEKGHITREGNKENQTDFTDSEDAGMYEDAGHHYFTLEKQK